jgi:hypothetical protein
MRARLRSLLGLLGWTAFTTNSVAPGLLHRCDAAEMVASAASGAGSHDMAGMAGMEGMHDMAGMPAHEHAGHDAPAPGRPSLPGDCYCIGHSCCSAAMALPATPFVLRAAAITVTVVRATLPASQPVHRPAHLLPFAQAPPILA